MYKSRRLIECAIISLYDGIRNKDINVRYNSIGTWNPIFVIIFLVKQNPAQYPSYKAKLKTSQFKKMIYNE